MATPHDPASDRPERESHQPLAEINKTGARDARPDPEFGRHGPVAGETGDRPTDHDGHRVHASAGPVTGPAHRRLAGRVAADVQRDAAG